MSTSHPGVLYEYASLEWNMLISEASKTRQVAYDLRADVDPFGACVYSVRHKEPSYAIRLKDWS